MASTYQPAATLTRELHNMLTLVLVVLVTMTAFLTGARPARAAAAYTITDLGTLDTSNPGGCCSRADGINGAGEVVGHADYDASIYGHAFLYQGGVMHDLGELNGPSSWAGDINSARQVVGGAYSGGSTPGNVAYSHAVLWENGVIRDLGTLGGSFSDAAAINDSGQVVGWADTTYPQSVGDDTHPPHAFLWENGVMRNLGTLIEPERFTSYAYDINATSQVVGESSTRNSYGTQVNRAVLWENGVIRDLGTLGGEGKSSGAKAINDTGQVVGWSHYISYSSLYHAFLWENGVMRDLGTLGGSNSEALAINNKGRVVGSSYTAGDLRHAFLSDGTLMRDLNDLIPAGSGWELNEATDINDAGQIVGTGYFNGNRRAFLLTPVTRDTAHRYKLRLPLIIDARRPAPGLRSTGPVPAAAAWSD
jgi:probable HAF family extracellular repeat protein